MPLTKRLKECIAQYLALLAECRSAHAAVRAAQAEYGKAQRAMGIKMMEINKELDSCIPADVTSASRDRLVEIDGKTYVIAAKPQVEPGMDIAVHIREIHIER